MSAIKLSTPSSGSISLSPANTASNLTITVPATAGTMALTSNIPASYTNADVLTLFSASGSAPVYACRAWVNWNGTDNTIRGSGNVSSITINTTGDYTVNFTTALSDVNYAIAGYAGYFGNTTSWLCGRPNGSSSDYTTSSCRVVTSYQNTALTAYTGYVTVSIFR